MTRLIDADVLMQKIETYLPTFSINPSKIVELVETAPTVERSPGKWICKGAVGDGTWCSSCDTRFRIYPNRYKFCPNCGIPMREEGDNE